MGNRKQIIAAAKEAGINRAFVCAKPDECPDDDGCCHGQKPDGYWIKDEQLERFYTIAFLAGFKAGKKHERELSIIRSEVD